MRNSLAAQAGERKKFNAVFVRLGKKTNYKGYSKDTILFKDVCEADTNRKVTDHLWFSYSKAFEKVELKAGNVIEFEARVKSYTKGYLNKRYHIDKKTTDFKLSHPTRIKNVAV